MISKSMLRLALFLFLLPLLHAQAPIELIAVENSVEKSSNGRQWAAAKTGDRLDYGMHVRTGEYSRAALRFPSGNVIRLSEFSNMRLARPKASSGQASAKTQLKKGAMHFFSRQPDAEKDIQTASVNAAIRGTEFEIRVLEDGTTELTLFEGNVVLSNPAGELELNDGERSRTAPGAAPQRLPMIDASRHIQWYLYYPAILDVDAMNLKGAGMQASLKAYRAGDLLGALEAMPAANTGDAAVYRASLILASGQVEDAGKILRGSKSADAAALLELITTVKGGKDIPAQQPQNATGWLARSYTLQANGDILGALTAAERATEATPELGYAWSRLASLQFSTGRIQGMGISLEKARELSPMNAEASVLSGFERAAHNDLATAELHFTKAIEVAPAYGDAWLGLGLIQFKQQQEAEALRSLTAAAALEPNRSILRSYLGKGFAEVQRDQLALKPAPSMNKALYELSLAQKLDPADPTPWLYSALLKQDSNRPIEAIRDLQESIRLNDNRSLFRSRMLLDEDLAVRRSNLAEIYQDAGLPTQALTEAGKAGVDDYLNFASHDFMARAYGPLLDPAGLAQRYGTVVSNELFLRNILAPAGAGLAAQSLSNQEYTSLFNQQGWGNNTRGTYDSRNRYSLSNFTSYNQGPFAFAAEVLQEDWGTHHFNDDFNRNGILTQFKYDLSPKDRLYATILYQDSEQGDVRQITNPDAVGRATRDYTIDASGRTIFTPPLTGPPGIDPNTGREIDPVFGRDPELRAKNWQEPLVFLSYGRDWNPEHTTLALVGHTNLRSEIYDPLRPVTSINSFGAPALRTYESSLLAEQEFQLGSVELQHIFKQDHRQFILGARYQGGEVEQDNTVLAAIPSTMPSFLYPILVPDAIDSAGSGRAEEDFTRWSTYAYYTHEFNDRFSVIGGVSLEAIDFADGLQSAPFTNSRKKRQMISPKLGIVWQLDEDWTLRAAAARSMSGYSIEDQLRLEPTQVAGLVTTYRSLIPTTATGTMAGGTNDNFTINLSGALDKDTWLTVEAFHGRFSGDRSFGVFEESVFFDSDTNTGAFPTNPGDVTVGSYRQDLDYEETSLMARLDHLLTDEVSIGASARWQHVEMEETLNTPTSLSNPLLDGTRSDLIVGSLYGRYQRADGWFMAAEAEYWMQDNDLGVVLEDASMPILNLSIGRMLQNQRGRLSVSILNVLGEDDGLNSLNYFVAPPDERVFTVSLDVSF